LNFLFDTTALVAHALREPGAEKIQSLIADEDHDLYLSALSLFELAGVLKRNGSPDLIPVCWEAYQQIAEVIPVDATLAQSAWNLRSETGKRLPIADAVIAATALSRSAVLVHRDEHLARIPKSLIPQIRLSSR
jgi:predicted nucleic acid-binding protein